MSKAENYESDILNEIYDEISPSELKKVEKRMLLAQKISDGIKANSWRKIDFARALNKRPSEVTKWLSGTHNFNTDTLFDIEEVLGIELITTETQPKEQVITFHLSVSQRQSNFNKSIYSSTPHLSLSEENSTLCEYHA